MRKKGLLFEAPFCIFRTLIQQNKSERSFEKMTRIYISGAITSDPDFERKFEETERTLKSFGFIPVNPAKLAGIFPEGEYEEYMAIDFVMLQYCQAVVLLESAIHSSGAKREIVFAQDLGIPVFRPDETDKLMAWADSMKSDGKDRRNT